MLKKIFESTLIMGASSAVVMAMHLVRVKVLAVFLGPSGVGTLSVLNHFHTLAATVIGLGLGTGIVKYTATFKNQRDEESVQGILSNSFQIVFLFSVIALLLVVILRSQISIWILGDPGYGVFVIIYAFSLPLAVYPSTTNSFLQGLKRIRALAKINVLRTFISLMFVIPLVFFFRLEGAVASVLVITTVHLLLNKYYLGKEANNYRATLRMPFDPGLVRKLLQYGMTSLFVGTAYYSSHLLLNIIIVDSLGLEMNGIYQPIWALTMTYLTFVLSSMSAYSYPRLCEMTSDRDIREELNGILRVAVLLITPVMFFLLLGRRPLIQILYSRSFLEAAEYMPIQIMGDFFKLLCWCVGMYLLPTKRLITFILLNLLQDILLVLFAALLVKRYQLYGITTAFALSYVIAFVAFYWSCKRQIGFALWGRNKKLLICSFTALAAIIISGRYLALLPYITVVVLVILCWSFLSVKREEVGQVMEYLSRRLGDILHTFTPGSP